ncbi:MAG: hypothetical protein GY698_24045 [Actinomycetia bacterium]|nr:hypothetical protein [Actinomycetes bacterium]
MTDLDIDIDIPDDDGLDAPPPVLDRGDQPPLWPKLTAVAAGVVLTIAGYGYFASPETEPTATPEPTITAPSTAATAAPDTATPEPEVTRTLDAVAAWERFAYLPRPLPAEIRRAGLVERLTEVTEAADRYRSGVTLAQLATHYGIGQETIRRELLGAGIELRPGGGRHGL